MEPLALRLEEARHAGRLIRRLDELDLRLPHREERDPDVVSRNVHHGFELQAQHVPVEAEGFIHRPNDVRDVMDAAKRVRSGPGVAWIRHGAQRTLSPWRRASSRARSSFR